MDQPLIKRKARLASLPEKDVLTKIRYVEGNGMGLFQAAGEAELEGIVLKRKDSLYAPGKRSWSWQKVIHWQEAEVVIIGYRKDEPRWLIAIEWPHLIRLPVDQAVYTGQRPACRGRRWQYILPVKRNWSE